MKDDSIPIAASSWVSRLGGIVVGLLCLGAALGVADFYLKVFPAKPWSQNHQEVPTYDSHAMQQAVDPAQVELRQKEILAFGSRFLGQPGARQTGDYLRDAFQKAGLEVLQHDVTTASPLTVYREIYRTAPGSIGYQQDQKLADVEVYPFFPNYLQPITTGDEGITGELVLATPELLKSGQRFDGQIALIDAKDGAHDSDYGFNWIRYANAGFKAVIVSDSEGLDHVPWALVGGRVPGQSTEVHMVSSAPVNFVRLAATPAIFGHVGENIRLRVQVRFVQAPNTTYYAVFHASHPVKQALVLMVAYDTSSILPDSAVGGIGAISPAFALQFLEGLQSYKDSIQRDVIFVAYGSSVMGDDGINHLARILQANTKKAEENPLLTALGLKTPQKENQRVRHLDDNEEKNRVLMEPVEQVNALFDDSAFLRDPSATERSLDRLSDAGRKTFSEQFAYVVNSVLLELSESVLQRKLDFLRTPGQDIHSVAFQNYMAARRDYDAVLTYAGYSAVSLLHENPAYVSTHSLRDRLAARFLELGTYHRQVRKQLEEEKAIARLFDRYEGVSFFTNLLAPAAEETTTPQDSLTAFLPGDGQLTPRGAGVINVFQNAVKRLGLQPPAFLFTDPPPTAEKDLTTEANPISLQVGTILNQWGYSTYSFFNLGRQASYKDYASPVIQPYMLNLESLRGSFAVIAGGILAMAHGEGPVSPSVWAEWLYKSYGGQVLVSGVGQTVVPNYPLDGATVANRSLTTQELYSQPGYYYHPIVMTDPYGRFQLEYNSNDFPVWWRAFSRGLDYSPIAAGYDQQGFIRFIKDVGDDGQRLFKSEHLKLDDPDAIKNATIVTFRAAPLALLDLTNPQTMRSYTDIDMLSAEGLTEFDKKFWMGASGLMVAYLEPDRRAYILLQAGPPGNDLVQETRAFLLGVPSPWDYHPTREIEGPGYLVADHPLMSDIALEAARSMASVNGFRLDLQKKYHMDDSQTEEYQERTLDDLSSAEKPGQSEAQSVRSARDAVTYATLNHPVIRQKVVEAVIGILWYLGLLVPFVFFFEKLVFGFSDVRKQIAAQMAIFLTAFFLLWILHPAFAMVRSSLMILLGFVIMLISGGLTILFSSKFKENLADLRKRQGRVAGADVNVLGVMGTAFLLGLNNMHRRKVRTGLTCATLTLLTFVMISFTSVQNDLVEEDIAIGKAPYQGMLIKNENFQKVTDAEYFAFQSKYGNDFDVCLRRIALGNRNFVDNKRTNPSLTLIYQDSSGNAHSYLFNSVLQMAPREPLRDKIQTVTKPAWFTPEQSQEGGVLPILIPDTAASAVGISKEAVEAGGVPVRIEGHPCQVIGIFKADSLDALCDLDGRDLKPFNIEATPDLGQSDQDSSLSASDDSPRIPAEKMFISPLRDVGVSLLNSSLAIGMPDATYKQARDQIVSFMEQTAQPIYYGLDGIAYKGKRTREVSLKGLIDLIIPLIIAGLTVLNTMKGSVYERREEIFVYNAVGIAPRYIFFMFMAEALVYAVVGAVLGYFLSQGLGRILTELGWTGGLNMTYTSLSTIYASLIIMAAVFVSTYFPAKSAMEIAKPTEDSGWKLPEPVGDVLAFDLPFNFIAQARMAVLAFFNRYLLDHAEGSAGRFLSAEPRMIVETTPAGDAVPCLETTIWLKPFDLAVSQRLVISMPKDEETGQFKARITLTRISGTRESWLRLNQSFVALLRRHFLHWRAVGAVEQAEMFEEARTKFQHDLIPAPKPTEAVLT